MKMGEMAGYTARFKAIQKSKASQEIKDRRLAALMSDLEAAYEIPMLKKPEFEQANPFVMQLYRTVSEARSL